MNLDKYLVIAGFPGVHKLVASRSNGLLIEDKHEGRTRFVAARQGQITPLASIAVYTETEEGTIALADVFQKMLDQFEQTPPPAASASSAEFRQYFTTILPEHDQDRVHINDIKKCVKWFQFMRDKNIFAEAQKEAENAENAEIVEKPTETGTEA